MAVDRTASEYNSILQMTYEEWGQLSEAEREAHCNNLVAGMTETQREDLLVDLAEECNEDGDFREQLSENFIEQIRARISAARRAHNDAMVQTGHELIAALNADLDAWAANPTSMQEEMRDGLGTYGETHIVRDDGSPVEIRTDDYDNPITEITLGGRYRAESPFGEQEQSVNERLVAAGLLVEERNNQYAIAEGHTQAEIDARIEQWRQEELNQNQRVTFYVEEGQHISLLSNEPPTFRVTDEDGTTHDYIFRGSEEGVIFVFTGGIDESDFNTIRSSWGSLADKCYWLYDDGTLSESFHDNLGGSLVNKDKLGTKSGSEKVVTDHRTDTARPNETDPEFRPEGYNDVRSALSNIREYVGDSEAAWADDYQAAVDELYQAIADNASESEILALWNSFLERWDNNHEMKILRHLVVAFHLYGAEGQFEQLFRPALRLIEQKLWNGEHGDEPSEHNKVAILLLESVLGPGEYPLDGLLAQADSSGRPESGDWTDHEGTIDALHTLRIIPGTTLPENYQVWIDNEEALVGYEEEGPGAMAPLIEDLSGAESFFRARVYDFENEEGIAEDAMAQDIIDFLKRFQDQLTEGMTVDQARGYISNWLNFYHGNDREDDYTAALIYLLHNYAPELFSMLIEDEDWIYDMGEKIGNGGGNWAGSDMGQEAAMAALGLKNTDSFDRDDDVFSF